MGRAHKRFLEICWVGEDFGRGVDEVLMLGFYLTSFERIDGMQ